MANSSKPASEQQSISYQATKLYKGPLPSPETLARYEQVQQGFASRVIHFAEQEASHRRSIAKKVIWMNFILSLTGMHFGLFAVGGVLLLCYYAFSLVFGTQAAGIASVVLAGVGGVFLWKQNSKK